MWPSLLTNPRNVLLLLLFMSAITGAPIVNDNHRLESSPNSKTSKKPSSRRSVGRPPKRKLLSRRSSTGKFQKLAGQTSIDEVAQTVLNDEVMRKKKQLEQQLTSEIIRPPAIHNDQHIKRQLCRLQFHVGAAPHDDPSRKLVPLTDIFPTIFNSFLMGLDCVDDIVEDAEDVVVNRYEEEDEDGGDSKVTEQMLDAMKDDVPIDNPNEINVVDHLVTVMARFCDSQCPSVSLNECRKVHCALLAFASGEASDVPEEVHQFIDRYRNCFQGIRTLRRRLKEVHGLTQAREAFSNRDTSTALLSFIEQLPIPRELKNTLIGRAGVQVDRSAHHQKQVMKDYESQLESFRKDMSRKCDTFCSLCRMMSPKSEFQKFRRGFVLQCLSAKCASCVTAYNCHGCQQDDELCRICQRPLRKKQIPPLAYVNSLDFTAEPPSVLTKLNFLERMLIQKARVLQTVVHLKDVSKRYTNVKACAGAQVIVPTSIVGNLDAVFEKLPSSKHLQIVVHTEWEKQYLVSMKNVIDALEWLKANNEEYKNVVIDRHFRFTKGVDVFFEKRDATKEDVELLIKDNDTRDGRILKVHEFVEVSQTVNQPPGTTLNPLAQFDLIKSQYNPLLKKAKHADVQAFVTLFPFGRCGQDDANRSVALKPSQYLRSVLLNSSRRIASNPYWMAYQYARKIQNAIASCQGIQSRNNKLTSHQLVDRNDPTVFKSLSSVFTKVRGFKQYWRTVRNRLMFHVAVFGPPTFFLTINPAERQWKDLHELYKSITGRPVTSDTIRDEIAADPVPWSRYWQKRVKSFFKNVILQKNGPLGEVVHFFTRVEYQHRGTQHVHCLLWTKEKPGADATPDEVRSFIDSRITCRMPGEDEPELRDLVLKYQGHHPAHNGTCIRFRKRSGKLYKECRFHFPRPVTPLTTLLTNKPDETCKSKRLYDVARQTSETMINDYNPAILLGWGGNIDIQFVGTEKNVMQYVTTYTTKGEVARKVDNLKDETPPMTRSATIYALGIDELNSREVGGPEMSDELLGHPNFTFDTAETWIPTDPIDTRSRMLQSKSRIEENGDVYLPNLIDFYYPNRPAELECFSLYNVATNYRCSAVAESDKDSARNFTSSFTEFHTENRESPMFNHNSNGSLKAFKIPGTTKKFIRKKQTVGRFHIPEVDRNSPETIEEFYRRLCILFIAWRSEIDFLETCGASSYFEAFHNHLNKLEAENKEAFDDLSKCLRIYEGMESDRKNARETARKIRDELRNVQQVDVEELQIKARCVDEETHRKQLDMLNAEQRLLFDKVMDAVYKSEVEEGTHLRLFTSGTAGTGKSFIINCLADAIENIYGFKDDGYSKPAVIIGAPTGLAAISVDGQTIHSLLGLTVKENGEATYEALSDEQRDLRRALFSNVKLIILDEVSMIGAIMLAKIRNRLREIGNPNIEFGGYNIIIFGDLLQLAPVRQRPAFHGLTHFEARTYFGGKSSVNLWRQFEFFELFTNMRQKDDLKCTELLDRVRINNLTETDKSLLMSRLIAEDQCSLEQAARRYINIAETDPRVMTLMGRRRDVNEFNAEVTRLLTTNTVMLIAKDTSNGKPANDPNKIVKRRPWQQKEHDLKGISVKRVMSVPPDEMPEVANGLVSRIDIFTGCRVMLVRNVDKIEGLVNGLTGIVERLDYDGGTEVTAVQIRFDRYPAKLFEIKRFTVTYSTVNGERRTRNQFPLQVAHAVTIHKAQGMTLNNVVISTEGLWDSAQFYVATSRVKRLSGLHFINLNFDTIKVDPKAMEEYDRLRGLNESGTER